MHGLDMRRVPVEMRRVRLQEVLNETELLRFSKQLDGPADQLLASACKMGLEGIIGKRRGSFWGPLVFSAITGESVRFGGVGGH